jgi:AhpC/TSA family protein
MTSAAALGEAGPATLAETADRRARLVDRLDPPENFNFRHFRMWHMAAEILRTGLPIGAAAPDVDLPTSDGLRVRLSGLSGGPVLLHFVSYTCPVTRGGIEAMRELHRLYGDRLTILEVLVRQAHPGERHGAYTTAAEKVADAREYVREERVPWPVLVDDLAGTVQRAYGGLAAAVYLIDRFGRVAFCGTWGQSPALRQAIDDLLADGGTRTPAGRVSDRRPHLAGAIVAGQRGPLRGGYRALVDLELGFPGAMALMTAGRLTRPLLAPLAVRTTPLPAGARAALAIGAAGLGVAVVLARRGRRKA